MTETLKKLLQLLLDGQFHSGEQLGKALGVTRSAIWKLIKQLEIWDLTIESVTNKGYRITEPLTLLDKPKILSFLEPLPKNQLNNLEILDTIPSTNDYLMENRQAKLGNVVCLAEKQTKAKGRRARNWVAPFAKNIYLSILWRFPQEPSELSGLSLIVAMAVIEALRAYGITHPLGIKWPNDVMADGKKLAGVLVEIAGESNDICSAVIGIGLNVNMSLQNARDITQPWIDVQSLTPKSVERNKLTGLLLNQLLKTLAQFEQQGFLPFMPQWQPLDLTLGKPLSLQTATTELQGIGCGINAQGHLLIDINGEQKHFSGGDVSLRLSK